MSVNIPTVYIWQAGPRRTAQRLLRGALNICLVVAYCQTLLIVSPVAAAESIPEMADRFADEYKPPYFLLNEATKEKNWKADTTSKVTAACNRVLGSGSEKDLLECIVGSAYAIGRLWKFDIKEFMTDNNTCRLAVENSARFFDRVGGGSILRPDQNVCLAVQKLVSALGATPKFGPCGSNKKMVDWDVAICAGGAPGSAKFNEMWRTAAKECAEGRALTNQAVFDSTLNTVMKSHGDAKPNFHLNCDGVARIVDKFGIQNEREASSLKDGLMAASGLDPSEPSRIHELEKAASDGSDEARFHLAVSLLAIDKDWRILNGPQAVVWRRRERALEEFKILAAKGHSGAIFRFLQSARNSFDLSAGNNAMLRSKEVTYVEILQILSDAGYAAAELEMARWEVNAVGEGLKRQEFTEAEFFYRRARSRLVSSLKKLNGPDVRQMQSLIDKLDSLWAIKEKQRVKLTDIIALITSIGEMIPRAVPTDIPEVSSACDRAQAHALETAAYAGEDAALSVMVGNAWGGC